MWVVDAWLDKCGCVGKRMCQGWRGVRTKRLAAMLSWLWLGHVWSRREYGGLVSCSSCLVAYADGTTHTCCTREHAYRVTAWDQAPRPCAPMETHAATPV